MGATWRVEVKFDGASWTDITGKVLRIPTIRRGRSDDLSATEAGRARIVLDNTDGRFTPENTQGTYSPNVKPAVDVRVQVAAGTTDGTYVDADVTYSSSDTTYSTGTFRIVFVGKAVRWEPRWGVGELDMVVLEAVDGFEQLRQSELEYPVLQTALDGDVNAYWTLGEAAPYDRITGGWTLTVPSDASTEQAALVNGGVGSLIGGHLSDPEDGMSIAAGVPSGWYGKSNDLTVSAFVRYDDTGNQSAMIMSVSGVEMRTVSGDHSIADSGWMFRISGLRLELEIEGGGGQETKSSNLLSWDADTVYHVGFWWDQSTKTATFYRDGSSVGSGTFAAVPDVASPSRVLWMAGSGSLTDQQFSDVALWTSDQSALMDDLSDAAGGFASDSPSTRIGRLLDTADWPAGTRSLDTGTTPLSGLDASNSLAGCQDAAAADGGVFYISKGGDATFQGRRGRWEDDSTVVFTFDDDGTDTPYQQVGWTYDTTYLSNRVIVDSDTQGTSDGIAEDATSISAYGRRVLTIPTISNNSADNAERAGWELSRRKDPHLRLRELALLVSRDIQEETAAAVELQDLVRVLRRPGGSQDDVDVDLRVASIAHEVAPAEWRLRLGLVEADSDQPGVYGTAVYGTDFYGY